MFIEVTLKNRILQLVITDCNSKLFSEIYERGHTYHNSFTNATSKKKAFKKKLDPRNTIWKIIAEKYDKNMIVTHFYDNNYEVPIWGVFELLSLGNFGYFVSCLDVTLKIKSEHLIGINSSYSSNGGLTEKIIYIIKDLRNALSHNDPIFDTRFRRSSVHGNLINTLQSKTNIQNISFDHITDYLILTIFILKQFGVQRNELLFIIQDFNDTMYRLRARINSSDFMKIFPSNTLNKITQLKLFVK